MRITMVVPSLGCGGTERIVATMANYWVKQGKLVTVLTCDSENVTPFYSLEENVKHRALNILGESKNYFSSITNNLSRIIILRNAIKQSTPNIVISFLAKNNVRVLLATRGLKIPVIVSERSDPSVATLTRIWKLLIGWTYAWAVRISVFTRQAGASFARSLQHKISAIPNPIAELGETVISCNEGYSIVSVGRLEEEKGVDLLIQAFALVVKKMPDATLTIWGEGSQKSKLYLLSKDLKIADKVFFSGVTKNINQAFEDTTIFVQASRCEGFGNALCEAMAMGLPVISTACSGPQEIIRHNYDGLLVPVNDIDALAAAIIDLLNDKEKRIQLAKAAPEVIERFSLKNVMNQWDDLIAEVNSATK